ncbi:expressed protein [Echinococcus multilocularis]|uniref:Expressed protein n=1 Tax=Echinococcus multilocularis TaxID=6211 RepID=A0A068YF71_ECHMU|nr:expressed protein [Echinococcus multilocularis]
MAFPPKYCSPLSPFRCCQSSTNSKKRRHPPRGGGSLEFEALHCPRRLQLLSNRMRWNFTLCNLTAAAKFFRGLSAQPLIESIQPV